MDSWEPRPLSRSAHWPSFLYFTLNASNTSDGEARLPHKACHVGPGGLGPTPSLLLPLFLGPEVTVYRLCPE